MPSPQVLPGTLAGARVPVPGQPGRPPRCPGEQLRSTALVAGGSSVTAPALAAVAAAAAEVLLLAPLVRWRAVAGVGQLAVPPLGRERIRHCALGRTAGCSFGLVGTGDGTVLCGWGH